MHVYRLCYIGNIKDFLLQYLESDLLIPSLNDNELTFFKDGDKLAVNLDDGLIQYEPLNPHDMFHSKITMRFHQWLGKGLVRLEPAPDR